MKVLILQIFLASIVSSASVFPTSAQGALQRKITLHVSNENVKRVLKKMEETGAVRFVYQPQVLNASRHVSLAVEETSIADVLGMILERGIVYEEMGDLVVLKPGGSTFSTVRGRVTDEKTGEPLPDVNVAVKGTAKGVITDEKGSYSLTVEGDDAVLVFSFVGYITQEEPLGMRSIIDRRLSADQKLLEGVVVVGYGAQQKGLLSGSVVFMKMDEVRRNTPTTSLGNLLAGQMAGVKTCTPTGIPGTQPAISIRNKSSWNDQNVLYVIDGKISDAGDFNNLSPNDIDNISVLKDAASAAAYGARAAGGVVVVTTGRGTKNSQTSVTYSYNTGVDVRGKNAALTNAVETGEIYNRIHPSSGPAGPAWTQADFDYFKNINGGWGYDQLAAVWANPYTSTHNLSVSGGGDKITYFVGGSYTKQGAFMKNLTFDKYNFRTNMTAYLTKNLHLFAGLTVNNNLTYTPVNTGVGDVQGIYRKQLLWQPEQPVWTDGGNPIDYGWIGNVGAEIRGDGGYVSSNSLKPAINVKATCKIPPVPGLQASVQYSKAYANDRKKTFGKQYDMWVMKTLGSFRQISTKDADLISLKKSSQIDKDYIVEDHNWSNDYQVNFQVSCERTLAKAHHVNSWLVYEQAGASNGGISAGRETFPVYTTDQWWAAGGDRQNEYADGRTVVVYARKSWVGQAFYDYDQKYMAAFTCRYDGSPNFPKEKRWGLFPSASIGWVISRENFFRVKAVNFLKLRASSGLTSADNIKSWQWQQSYVGGNSAYLGTEGSTNVGITYGGITNPNVTWEKTRSSNIACDINFLEYFNATAEYYYVKTYDILGARMADVPPTFPRSLPSSNYGEMSAGGVDFSLGYHNNKRALTYYADMNLNYGGATYITRDENITYPWQKTAGYSTTRIVDRVCTGMIRTRAELDAFKSANPAYTYYGIAPDVGQLTYEDLSGPEEKPDGKIDEWDKKTLYENNNPVVIGINFGATWKGLTAEVTFSGNLHQKWMMNDLAAGNVEWNRVWQKWYTDGWTPEHTNSALPRRYSINDEAKRVTNDASTFWLKNADFLRLKLLHIGYSIPENFIKKTGISGFKIYFSGTNLFLFSKFNDLYYDPEMNDAFSYPAMKNFNFGIQVSL